MTNPFEARRMARARRYRNGGPIQHFDAGGLFSSTPGSSSSKQQSYFDSNTQYDNTSAQNLDPAYWNQAQNYFQRVGDTANIGYSRYPTEDRYAPLTKDQQLGIWNTRESQGSWQPDTNTARNMFQSQGQDYNTASAIDPIANAQPYLDKANAGPSALQASGQYRDAAAQTWPGAADEYMAPYTDRVVNRIADLGQRNLTEKLLPHVNEVFTGAQFGRSRHGDFTNRAVRDTNESILGQQSEALERGYKTASDIFGNDQTRMAGLGTQAGNAASSDISNYSNMAGTAGNIATNAKLAGYTGAAGKGTTGQNFANLGQNVQNSWNTDNKNIMDSGNFLQGYNQLGKDFDYTQYQNMAQWPISQTANMGANLRGIPVNTSTTGSGSSNTSGSSTTYGQSTATQPGGSVFGQIAGGALGLASLATPSAGGGASALGNIFGSIFKAADGGPVPGYDVGGYVPTVDQMRQHTTMMHPQPQPQQPGMMPTGMPGMPPIPSLVPNRPQPNGQPGGMPFAEGGAVPGAVDPNADLNALWEMISGRAGMAPPMPQQMPMQSPFEMMGSDNGSTGAAVGVAGDNGGISGTGDTYARGGNVDCHKGPFEIITKLNFARGGYMPYAHGGYCPFGSDQ